MMDADNAKTTPQRAGGLHPRELMRLHREQLRNYWPVAEGDGFGVSPAGEPPSRLSVEDLPADIQALVARYEESRAGTHLTPVRYLETSGNSPSTTMSWGELPDEDHFVSLSITEAVVDVDGAEVHTRVLVAKQSPPEPR